MLLLLLLWLLLLVVGVVGVVVVLLLLLLLLLPIVLGGRFPTCAARGNVTHRQVGREALMRAQTFELGYGGCAARACNGLPKACQGALKVKAPPLSWSPEAKPLVRGESKGAAA